MMKNRTQISLKIEELVTICSDTNMKDTEYSDFVTSVFLSAFEVYGKDGKLSEDDLMKYINESIKTSKLHRKAA
ncbi:MAG: hypothetical protein EHM20_06115 [Alphaproteobacteria bacterium]|nr:MAG: hypothetical protein EHM20_06115 [Alphaproteobacteria bacterium]